MIEPLIVGLSILYMFMFTAILLEIYSVKNELIYSKFNSYGNYSLIESVEYNPDKDVLALFVGTEEEVPPEDVMSEIKEKLDNIKECNLLIFPGLFRIVVLKGERNGNN